MSFKPFTIPKTVEDVKWFIMLSYGRCAYYDHNVSSVLSRMCPLAKETGRYLGYTTEEDGLVPTFGCASYGRIAIDPCPVEEPIINILLNL